MELIGELSRSFGNLITLRGIASIKDLARISKAETDTYQRNLQKKHGKAMKAFLDAGEYTFFPEVVLSLELPQSHEELTNKLYESVPHKSVTAKFNKFTIKGTTSKSKSPDDSRAFDYFCKGKLILQESNQILLKRIDGNHRLSVADKVQDKKIPFCIVFFKAPSIKFERVLFNNINFKSIPLTSEENLRLIFEKKHDKYIFSDEELKDPVWFGKDYVKARKLYHQLSLDNLPNLENILQSDGRDKFTRTALLELIQQHKGNITQNNLKVALKAVNDCYENYPQSQNQGYQLLVVHLYYSLKDKLPLFSKWVKDNHIYKLKHTDPASVIEIFKYVVEAKHRTIFLAMPICEETNQNYKAIGDAVDEINSKYRLTLKLSLIRIDQNKTGYSFAITDEILTHIEEGGYFIADISLANPNVYYEIGYQMGINKGKGKQQNNFLLIHNKGVAEANFNKDKSFNISHLSIEQASDSNNLRDMVKTQLKKYYGVEE